jgi:hypothetical protein
MEDHIKATILFAENIDKARLHLNMPWNIFFEMMSSFAFAEYPDTDVEEILRVVKGSYNIINGIRVKQ